MRDLWKQIGDRIRSLRDKRHWTQQELATRMQLRGHKSIIQTTQSAIELGQRRLVFDEVLSYARLFDVPLSEVTGIPDYSRDTD